MQHRNGRNRVHNTFDTLGVKIAAESLEVGTERDDIRPQILLAEVWVGRSKPLGYSELSFNLVQPRQAIILPVFAGSAIPFEFPSIRDDVSMSNTRKIKPIR